MPAEGLHRPAWAELSASAIAHNIRVIKRVIGDSHFCAVVKANGYGHGAIFAAHAAVDGGADSLAVAIIDEGMELRSSGITAPILLLAEVMPDALVAALENNLTLTIGSLDGAHAAVAAALTVGGRHSVHLKIDTGMHRMGVDVDDVDEVVAVLTTSPHIELEGLFTHFSVADGTSDEHRAFTAQQIEQFLGVVAKLETRGVRPSILHAANSAGALGYPRARLSMVRVGLALYGYLPDPWLGEALDALGEELRPVLTLRSKVVARRRAPAGDRPSYGRRRELLRESTIVTVPFGYADGYPRRLLDAGAEVLINGTRYPLAGTVTMDQIVVDVGDDVVVVGDDVVLLGAQGDDAITADEWAQRAATISYEILCGIGARVPRFVVT
jgi:alanine racemase